MLDNLSFRQKILLATAIPPIIAAVVSIAALGLGDSVVRLIGFVGLFLAAAAGGLALVIRRELVARLEHASDAAEQVANKRLPKLVEATNDEVVAFDDFDGAGDDEVGRIVGALNTVQTTTAGLAGRQHEEIREGLSELVVNLVRRNQSLLDRQITHIDELESSEEDPDRLEELFGVDHLATRMRRNAESLLVLAGSEPPRRRGEPIAINDLMRVAMSEIEGYRKVRLTKVDGGDVSAQAGFDIAHLLSELLENATQFSPPNSQVEMAGAAQDDGSYLVSIADHGIGMSPEQVDETNQLLLNPPELNLDLGRSLGFIVVGRLAQRLGLAVELAQTPGGAGVTALVLIPKALLDAAHGGPSNEDDTPAGAEAPAAPADEAPSAPATPAAESSTPAPAAPSVPVVPAGLDLPALDDEPGWTPPSVPERGSGGLGKRDVVETPAAPVQSEALARLLGSKAETPTTSPTDPGAADTGATESGPSTSAAPALPTREIGASGAVDEPSSPATTPAADTPAPEPAAEAPAPEPAPTPEPVAESAPEPERVPAIPETNGAAPGKLEEAIPTGEKFDQGVAGLLGDGRDSAEVFSAPYVPERGSSTSGLTRRDRSRSQAPVSEGRVIPDKGRAATASARDPEEIRNMLARYRKAREGNSPSPESSTESGEQA